MAEVTTKTTGVTFVLELTEAEAQYVHEALRRVSPVNFGGADPVWNALALAMDDAGVDTDASSIE